MFGRFFLGELSIADAMSGPAVKARSLKPRTGMPWWVTSTPTQTGKALRW